MKFNGHGNFERPNIEVCFPYAKTKTIAGNGNYLLL